VTLFVAGSRWRGKKRWARIESNVTKRESEKKAENRTSPEKNSLSKWGFGTSKSARHSKRAKEDIWEFKEKKKKQ